MWVTDPPFEKGYYLTYYWNKDENRHLYKAFWWNGKKWVWRFDPDVTCYWNVRHDYYCPCQGQEVDYPYE